MKDILYKFDVYPKVFLGNTTKRITIKPIDGRPLEPIEYTVKILKVDQSRPSVYPERSGRSTLTATPDSDGCLRFDAYFEGEGEHFINLYKDPEAKHDYTFSVYSLSEDMAGRIPLRGDLHVHTCRSDGREAPITVAANYRGHGYDFCVISDHRKYYPSLEAMEFYRGVTDMNIVPGEEIHLPLNDVHYVNFGGTYSINALVKPSRNDEMGDGAIEYRSLDGNAPDPMSNEEFTDMIKERAQRVDRAHEAERLSYAVLEWTFEHMQANGGLGIFPHPYWLCQTLQLPEDYTRFIYENAPFHAFEVLGGENYFSHNGFQTALYYEMRAKGIDRPIVGSTDSHGSTENNRNSLICSTIVFAKENSRRALIEAIKDKYSIAVDTISKEYRLVGDFRLMKYASFLMENYFPLHDLACRAEGYYMNQYSLGDSRAERILAEMKGQIPEMHRKYFEL